MSEVRPGGSKAVAGTQCGSARHGCPAKAAARAAEGGRAIGRRVGAGPPERDGLRPRGSLRVIRRAQGRREARGSIGSDYCIRIRWRTCAAPNDALFRTAHPFVTASTSPAPATATLAITGDVMLGRLVNEALARHGWDHPWGNLAPDLWNADAVLINLECAITARAIKWHDGHYKPFHFRTDPGAIEALRRGHVDFAALANNHIGDFGPDGLLDTVAALDKAGIAHAGAGRDLAAARAHATITARGLRIAILSFADYPEAWAATDAPGLNYTAISVDDDDFATVAAAIDGARAESDLVIVSVHWGPNMRERPPAEFRAFAHRVIDAGATIFWGHSAHIVQGIEFRPPGLILYDTGDFVDDYAVDSQLRNDLGALFLARVQAHALIELSLVPVRIDRMQVNRAAGRDREWFIRRLSTLCTEMDTDLIEEDGAVVRVVPAGRSVPF